MTISVPVAVALVSTNVADTTEVFSNTEWKPSYASGLRFRDENTIYENSGADYIIQKYDVADTYVLGQLVYKDGYITKTETGTIPKPPSDYIPAPATGYDADAWDTRYAKLQDIPTGLVNNQIDHTSGSTILSSFFAGNGTHYYENTGDTIYHYVLGTAYDLKTKPSTPANTKAYIGVANTKDFFISPDGTKLFFLRTDSSYLDQYSLSTPFDVSTMSTLEEHKPTGSFQKAFTFSHTGLYVFISTSVSGGMLKRYPTSAWNIGIGYGLPDQALGDYVNVPSGIKSIEFNTTGTKLYVYGTDNRLWEYTLSTAYDLSTASIASYKVINGGDYLRWKRGDGSGFYVDNNHSFYLYRTVSAWVSDTSMVSTSNNTFTRIGIDGRVYEYTLLSDSFRFRLYDSTFTAILYEYTTAITYVYTALNNSSQDIPSTILAHDGSSGWVANTVVIDSINSALYARTHLDLPAEIITIATFAFAIVTSPSELPNFVEVGATNSHRPLDGKNHSKAQTTSMLMTYTLNSETKFDTLALGKFVADNAVVKFKLPISSANYDLWLDGVAVLSGGNGIVTAINRSIDTSRDLVGDIEKWYTTELFYSEVTMEAGSTVDIELTIATGEIIELGTILLGMSVDNGTFTNLAMSHSYKDYSVAQYDEWGNLDYLERQRINTYKGTVDVPITNYDKTVRLMTSLGKKLVIVNGSKTKTKAPDSQTVFSSTQMIGRFMSFDSKNKIEDGDIERMAEYSFTLEELA